MQNPFETGHIKNYILLYVSVVVIMVLFFIAATLFHNVEKVDKKVFKKDVKKVELPVKTDEGSKKHTPPSNIKLLGKDVY